MENSNSTSHILTDRKLREEFVQNLNGTTKTEVMMFLSQIPLFVFVTLFVELCIVNGFIIENLNSSTPARVLKLFVILTVEIICIIVPIVFMNTVLSDILPLLLLIVSVVVVMMVTYSVTHPSNYVNYWKTPKFMNETLVFPKQPFITYFRSLTFLVTSVSILGVDFHVYPRRFAKTETYGVSLMDIGVGLFVFSNAIVIKTHKLLAQNLRSLLLESSVLIILGVFRYILIQRLDYQKHVTEYGIHWNFFITLAFVKVFSHALVKLTRGYTLLCGLILISIHQFYLNGSLEAYVLSDAERIDLFSSNREGVISLCGYVSIYLIGISISSFANSLTRLISIRKKINLLLSLFSLSFLLLLLLQYCNSMLMFKVSRRLANLPYVLWVLAVGVTLLSITLLVELLSVYLLPLKSLTPSKMYALLIPSVLESINNNGLLYFLLANLLTGLVNLLFDAYNLATFPSMMVLLSYMTVNCIIVYCLNIFGIKAKFW